MIYFQELYHSSICATTAGMDKIRWYQYYRGSEDNMIRTSGMEITYAVLIQQRIEFLIRVTYEIIFPKLSLFTDRHMCISAQCHIDGLMVLSVNPV